MISLIKLQKFILKENLQIRKDISFDIFDNNYILREHNLDLNWNIKKKEKIEKLILKISKTSINKFTKKKNNKFELKLITIEVIELIKKDFDKILFSDKIKFTEFHKINLENILLYFDKQNI